MPTRRWFLTALAITAAGCGGKKADDVGHADVDHGRAELRQMQETGAAPLNACRSRLKTAVKRTGRGPIAETIRVTGPVLCLRDPVFVDCYDVWQYRFKDVCGRTGYEQIKEPTSAPGDGKRFLADLVTAKAAYDAAVAAAATASPTAVYRERCWWSEDPIDFKLVWKDPATGLEHSFGTAVCQAEVTTLGAALEPIASVVAEAKAAAAHDGKLEQAVGTIDRANEEAMEKAAKQARDTVLAKVKS